MVVLELTIRIILLLLLIGINGILSSSEIAYLSLDKYTLSRKRDKKSRKIYSMLKDESKFLSTIQIGITLAGFMASAFASDAFTDLLMEKGVFFVSEAFTENCLMVVITLILSYITLVFGELFPKKIGRANPERMARFTVHLLSLITNIFYPVILLLTFSTNFLCRLFHIKDRDDSLTEKDIKKMIITGSREGIIEEKEKEYSKGAILKLSNEYNEYAYNQRYCMQKHKKLVAESVAIIKDAIANGIDFEVLNENKSTVEFRGHGNVEFVIEGNKTDRDNYIFPIITDDKYISKQEMKDAGLSVPEAILLDSDMDKQDIEELVSEYYNKKLVVKPRNTNYGTGITVFSKKATKAQILNAIDYAFKFDNNVLIEEYKKGMEYRFLVINGKVLSVCHRRIASVVGDGKSTIKELIQAKNKEPWHELTGTPVKMDQPVVEFLKLQELTYDSVIPANKRVFLRTNSNCSTGGESVDYTDIMPTKFKKIAEKAARVFDAKICGVDIIIDDMEKDEYSIIEINDNPGYSINEWPYEGRGEKIGVAILKLLNLMA